MQWLKGLIFVIIALVSLFVVLLWPHQQELKSIDPNTTESMQVTSKLYGLPMIWLEIENTASFVKQSPNIDYFPAADRPAIKDKKNYYAQELLINLICWGMFLVLVLFGFKILSRVGSK